MIGKGFLDNIMPGRSVSKVPGPLRVVAAVLEKDGRWLIAKRKKSDRFSGLWEFPGGKREPGESPRECLARELHEEFGIKVRIGRFLAKVTCTSPTFSIELAAYAVTRFSGGFKLQNHEEIRWILPSHARRYRLTEPDRFLLAKIIPLKRRDKP
jgi:mutator protein MutT